MNILIGGAWPYANGSLHIGHIAALLPGDVIARYHRAKGDEVLYISGSDCHGTPIAIRARKEGIPAKAIADKYHEEFVKCFNKLNFSYDYYFRTDDEYHKSKVQELIKLLYEKGLVYEKKVNQVYCESCDQFLPDRYVEGECPHCHSVARGDQCENCGTLLEPLELINRTCKLCGKKPIVRESKQLYFALSTFEKELKSHLKNSRKNWRINAVNNTERYLQEGLQDRAISRDLSVGIDVPIKGFEDKKIYVWIDAVFGYLTASEKWSETVGKDWSDFWNNESIAYFVHGKDNIPFHTIILPALLRGIGPGKNPDRIISSEYITLEGRKISTSYNWALWVPELIEKYNSDLIRYFFIANNPEKRDADFTWRDFINRNNGELLGAYGNLVNRTLVFAKKNFQGRIPKGIVDESIKEKLQELYKVVGEEIQGGNLKNGLDCIFDFIRSINKYFDEETPWLTINDNKEKCENTIYNCIYAIANAANLLNPYLPESSLKLKAWLKFKDFTWEVVTVETGIEIGDFHILFERIDKKIINEETAKLSSK